VLAEILNLHRVTGNVFARDSHFAGRLNVSVRTIGNAIAELEAQDYLARPYDPAARQKRVLVLTAKSLQNLQGVVADFATTQPESLQDLQSLTQNQAESDCKICNHSLQNLQGVVADFADINNTLNNNSKSLAEGEGVSVEYLASPANEQLTPLAADASTMPSPAPAEPAAPPAPKASRAGRKRAAPPAPAELLPDTCPLADLLNPGGLAAKVQELTEPLTPAQAERLLADYNLPALRAIFCEMANWKKLLSSSASANLTARNWLSKRPGTATAPAPLATVPAAVQEEELDEPARLFRAEQAAKAAAARAAHFAHWAAK